LYQVAICIACLHAGALLALRRKSALVDFGSNGSVRERATRMAGWGLIAVAAVPTVILFRNSFSLVMDYGYMSLFRNLNTLSTSLAFSAFLVPGIIFLLAGSAKKRSIQIFCIVLTAAYAGMYLFLGARGSAAMVCVAVAWVFDRSIRRIPRALILVMALLAMIVFPLISRDAHHRRPLPALARRPVTDAEQPGNPVSSSVSEMGHSLVTVTHTMTLVPEARPYDYGISYLYALTAIMPNIGWKVHPSVAHGLLSEWLVKTVDPVVAAAGGGLGFSFIAEAYLNFGPFGGPVWLA